MKNSTITSVAFYIVKDIHHSQCNGKAYGIYRTGIQALTSLQHTEDVQKCHSSSSFAVMSQPFVSFLFIHSFGGAGANPGGHQVSARKTIPMGRKVRQGTQSFSHILTLNFESPTSLVLSSNCGRNPTLFWFWLWYHSGVSFWRTSLPATAK